MFQKLILSGVSFYNVFIWGIFLQTFYTTWSCFSKTKNVNLWLSPHILVIFGWLENHVILFLHLKQIKIHFYKSCIWFHDGLYFGCPNSSYQKFCFPHRAEASPGSSFSLCICLFAVESKSQTELEANNMHLRCRKVSRLTSVKCITTANLYECELVW